MLIESYVGADEALENLASIKEKWGHKYPNAIKSWEDNWDNLITFLTFPDYIRKIMYTTNVIESLHSQFRKVTKTKLIFPNDESLMKMLYLATEKGGYSLWVPRFIVQQLEEDNMFDGLDPSIPPQPDCQVCDGTMTPKSYTGIRGVHYEYKK
ncbi:Transposase for insertion sequence element ISRM3 [Proteiniborus sp. DW1]|nr:Transposase for insertion sequence element ISRM3 [Proteiniborus sp. DW1]